MSPVRAMPVVGRGVTVRDLGWTTSGTVQHVAQDGRTIEVATETGERITFTLRPATARFAAKDGTAQLTFT
jgi:hypothetical protein